MTAHSVRILSELNMSSFACTQKRTPAFHQLRYQLHSAEGRAKCPAVPQRRVLLIGTYAAGQCSK